MKFSQFTQMLTENKVRQGLPHITTMNHEQLTSLTHGGKIHLHDMTEKTDGSTHVFGHDEHGFYTQYSGSGSEKMRSHEDYVNRAKRRAEETGKPLDLGAAHTFGHIHNVLASNKALQKHLKDQYEKKKSEVKVRGEVFYRPNAKEGDHPGEVKFVGTSYRTDHMGKVGKYVIHSRLPENHEHDLEHFKKHLSSADMNFDDDKIDHEKAHVDVKQEHEELKKVDHELLKQRTSKSNKEAKEKEQAKLSDISKRISDKVDAHIKKQNLSPKWGSGSEGIVVHPSTKNKNAPRFKVTSDAFRKYRESDEAKEFKKKLADRASSSIKEAKEEVHHASVIPLTGFSPISHMGHAHDLGGTLSKLPGHHHIGISSKAETFTGEERANILKRQWKDRSKNLKVHVDSSGGSVVSKAFHALPTTGRKVLHILVGHDRKSFAEGLKKSLEDGKIKEMNGHKWDEIHIHHPEGEERGHGMSGTKMRTAVANGDSETFRKHLGSDFSAKEADSIQNRIKSAIDKGEIQVNRPAAQPKKKKTLKEFLCLVNASLLEGGNVKIGEHQAQEIHVTPDSRKNLKDDVHEMLSSLHDSFHKEHGGHLFGKDKKALSTGSAFSGSTHHLMDSSISDAEFAKHKSKVGDLDVKIAKEHGDKLHAHLTSGKKFGKFTVIGTKRAGNDIHALLKHENGKIHQVDFEKSSYENHEPSKMDQFGRSSHWTDVKAGIKGMHHKLLVNASGGEKYKFSGIHGIKSRTDESDEWEGDPKKMTHKLFGSKADHTKLSSFHGVTELIKKHIAPEHHQAIYDKFKDGLKKIKGVDSTKALEHLKKHLSLNQNESMNICEELDQVEGMQIAKDIYSILVGGAPMDSLENPNDVVKEALRLSKTKEFSEEVMKLIEAGKKAGLTIDVESDEDEYKPKQVSYADFVKMLGSEKPGSSKEYLERAKKQYMKEEQDEDDEEYDEEDDMDDSVEEYGELSDKEIDSIVDELDDEDIIDHVYDDDEFVDANESDDEDDDKKDMKEECSLNEVLSRQERIRRAARFKRTETKRERARKIALHRMSSPKKITKRARKAAILAIKQKMFKGRDLSKLSAGEKERAERRVEALARSGTLARIALKIVPRIRKIEKERLSHG